MTALCVQSCTSICTADRESMARTALLGYLPSTFQCPQSLLTPPPLHHLSSSPPNPPPLPPCCLSSNPNPPPINTNPWPCVGLVDRLVYDTRASLSGMAAFAPCHAVLGHILVRTCQPTTTTTLSPSAEGLAAASWCLICTTHAVSTSIHPKSSSFHIKSAFFFFFSLPLPTLAIADLPLQLRVSASYYDLPVQSKPTS